jgi:hypothetical protein
LLHAGLWEKEIEYNELDIDAEELKEILLDQFPALSVCQIQEN